MSTPIMPKAVAVWLIDNTALTFEQIAAFCKLHVLEVKAIADGEMCQGIIGVDPVRSGQLSDEMISECTKDPTKSLVVMDESQEIQMLSRKTNGRRKKKYTPIARRHDKPDAIAWILKNCPEMDDGHIIKLIGTTKSTIVSIREKNHWNMQNIKPRNPVLLGLCRQEDFDRIVFRVRVAAERARKLKEINQDMQMNQAVNQNVNQDSTISDA